MTATHFLRGWWEPQLLPPAPSIADVRQKAPDSLRISGGTAVLAKNGQPCVSVVVPVYNGIDYLERAIDSVLRQRYESVEIIVVDGGSTDGTVELLRRYDHRLHSWLSEPDDGMYDAINKGISWCRGTIVKILNADDELTAHSMEAAASELAGGARALVRGNLEIINSAGEVLTSWTARQQAGFLPPKFPVLHPSWYLPRIVYEELGLYHSRYRVAADTDYFYRLDCAGVPIRHLNTALVRFREGGMSSGYGGWLEGLEIHARYLGRGRAAYITGRRGVQKAGAQWLRKMVGRQRYDALRSALGRHGGQL